MTALLNEELRRFWVWAGFSPNEMDPNNLSERIIKAEWEEEYPYWNNLQRAIDNEIEIYKETVSVKSGLLLLEALAIDHESELTLEKLMLNLDENARLNLIELGMGFNMWQARWQLTEILKSSDIPLRKEMLIKMIVNDNNTYVQRRALLSLSRIDPASAVKYALEKIIDADEYIRLICLRIIKKHKVSKLKEVVLMLKDDSSELIQEELLK